MIETNTSQRQRKAFLLSISLLFFALFLPNISSAQCFPDVTKPVAKCRNVTVSLDSTGQAGIVPLQVDNGSYDNCNTWYLILEHPCFYCSDIGNKNIILYVQDRAGNQSTCTAVVTVRDTLAPKLVLKSGFSTAIASTGSISVTAQQLLSTISDNCSALNKIQFGMRKVGGGTGFPTASSMTFTCADTGKVNVEIWAKDSTGNATIRTTSIQITDANKVCKPIVAPPVPAIIGNIRTESGKSIAAQITLNGGSAPAPTVVKSSDYNFSNLLRGGNYTLTAFRDSDWVNGVTTLDIALMTKHILDVLPFDSPYKVIAADANKDGEIDASDILFTRKLVLRQISRITGNTAWRFVPRNLVLPPVTSPPTTDLMESLTYNNLLDTVKNAQFVAIKTCDVNGTAQNLMSTNPTVEIRKKPLEFQINDQALQAGKTYEVDLSINETDASAFQFTLNYDKNILKIKNIQSIDLEGFSGSNFALFNEKGLTTISWNGHSLEKFQGLNALKITIEAIKTAQLSDAFLLTSDLTTAEAYNESGDVSDVKMVFKKQNGNSGNDFTLLPNAPNPFTNETQIRFRLPTDSEVQLTVFDETGRTIKSIKRSFSKGYNEMPLQLDDPSVSGVFYYQLKTATHTATRRLVRVK